MYMQMGIEKYLTGINIFRRKYIFLNNSFC
jgi:hypothetical protein